MRFSPLWGFVVLIAVAILTAGIGAKYHRNQGDLPPVEKEQEENEQKMADAKKQRDADNKQADAARAAMMTFDQAKVGAIKATLEIEGRGSVVLELYPKAAPKTVEHFVELCKSHFYDGLKFHRVVSGFVIQAGDPQSKTTSAAEFESKHIGSSGSGHTVPLEANLPHKKYTVGLARAASPDSGDSQFYINLNDNASLDGKYCIFGTVIQGQDVPAKVQQGDVIKSITIN